MSNAAAAPVILGVDGGGTKTIAVIADLTGEVLGYGRGGNCDIYSNPRAVDEVAAAVGMACSAAGAAPSQISTAAYSLCGCDWPEDFTHWQRALSARGLGTRIRVINDAVGALSSDVPDGNAIVIICGTGAATGSRNTLGDVWHSSFWQLTQGGAELSLNALHAVYRAELGINPPTSLSPRVLAHFGIGSVERLLHTFTGRDQSGGHYLAGLVSLLFDEAEAGDAAAHGIVEQHGAALAQFGVAAARKVDIIDKPVNLLLAGGVFRHRSVLMRDRIVSDLRKAMPQLEVVPSRSEPVKGAVTIALQMQQVEVDEVVSQRLSATLPPAVFFHTHTDDQRD